MGPGSAAPNFSLADVLLFPTLIRMEDGYAPLFGCSATALAVPALWELAAAHSMVLPGVEANVSRGLAARLLRCLFPPEPSGIDARRAPIWSTLGVGSPGERRP